MHFLTHYASVPQIDLLFCRLAMDKVPEDIDLNNVEVRHFVRSAKGEISPAIRCSSVSLFGFFPQHASACSGKGGALFSRQSPCVQQLRTDRYQLGAHANLRVSLELALAVTRAPLAIAVDDNLAAPCICWRPRAVHV